MKAIVTVLAVSFVFVLAEFTDEEKAKFKEINQSCIEETGIDPTVLHNLKQNGEFPENNEKLGCFATCMMKKLGFMNEDGEIDEQAIRDKIPAHIPQEEVDNLFAKCSGVTGTGCEKASNLLKCVIENKGFIAH